MPRLVRGPFSTLNYTVMKDTSKKHPKKGMDVDYDDDSLGENTEETPLTKEVKRDRAAGKDKKDKDKK